MSRLYRKNEILEKGLVTISFESKFENVVRKYFQKIPSDFMIYTTSPITFTSVIKYIKRRSFCWLFSAKRYIPLSAIDIGFYLAKVL